MIQPHLESVPAFYKGYVDRVKDLDLFEALDQSLNKTLTVLNDIPEGKGEFRYAEGKWSIKELLAHMLDVERIMAYRALRFARNDKTDLPGFEENDYAPQANAHARSLEQFAREMERLRETTVDLFSSFTPEMLRREGTANKNTLSVVNLGFIIAGHESHHRHILIERYLRA